MQVAVLNVRLCGFHRSICCEELNLVWDPAAVDVVQAVLHSVQEVLRYRCQEQLLVKGEVTIQVQLFTPLLSRAT